MFKKCASLIKTRDVFSVLQWNADWSYATADIITVLQIEVLQSLKVNSRK